LKYVLKINDLIFSYITIQKFVALIIKDTQMSEKNHSTKFIYLIYPIYYDSIEVISYQLGSLRS